MESWRHVWRNGVAPLLSDRALRALKTGLEQDDKTILQGSTTDPPPMFVCINDEVACACPLAYTGWQGEGLVTVGEVNDYFAKLCVEASNLLGDPAGIRWLTNWIDEVARSDMREALLTEVNLTIQGRSDEPVSVEAR